MEHPHRSIQSRTDETEIVETVTTTLENPAAKIECPTFAK
jgi:hypothetical protein